MKTFLKFVIGSSSKSLVFSVLLSSLSGLFGAALVAVISQIFEFGNTQEPVNVWSKVALFGVLIIAMLGFELFGLRILAKHSEHVGHEMRIRLSRYILNSPLQQVEAQGVAVLLASFTQDIKLVASEIARIPVACVSLFSIIGGFVYLLWLSWQVVVVMALYAIPSLYIYYIIHRKVGAQAHTSLDHRNEQVGYFKALVVGIKELQLNKARRNRLFDAYLEPSGLRYKEASEKLIMLHTLSNAWVQFVYFISIILIFGLVVNGMATIDILGPYILVALFLKSHVFRFLATLPAWAYAGSVLQRMNSEGITVDKSLGLASAVLPIVKSNSFNRDNLSLDVVNLRYTYVNESDTQLFEVGPINMSLKAPELVFIVGQNGAGKTTFAKLLSGLYTSGQPALKCNGIEINATNLESYRELFSVIFTVPYLFNEIENFEHYSQGQEALIEGHLKTFQLQYKIQMKGSSLVIPELSQGQQKRLALLLAFLDDRPVVIFDEWGENQDPQYKEIFYKELLPRLRDAGKLVLVITHESQYFHLADRVIDITSNINKLDQQPTQ
jgi:putative ATP-binding cassette transporter